MINALIKIWRSFTEEANNVDSQETPTRLQPFSYKDGLFDCLRLWKLSLKVAVLRQDSYLQLSKTSTSYITFFPSVSLSVKALVSSWGKRSRTSYCHAAGATWCPVTATQLPQAPTPLVDGSASKEEGSSWDTCGRRINSLPKHTDGSGSKQSRFASHLPRKGWLL